MSDWKPARNHYPDFDELLPRIRLAQLPTPVRIATLQVSGRTSSIVVKEDNLSASSYGGNKVRKLEYLLARARQRQRRTIATFGAVGSHHALATALYARQLGFDNIAFLTHQTRTPAIAATLNMHLELGTKLVPFGGGYAERIATLRNHLRGRRAMVIPMGGSSWLGTVAFIAAAFEVARQIERGECPQPEKLYVATGTMGTAAGLAVGFALCGLPIEVQAVRITPTTMTDARRLERLARKTLHMLHRLDGNIPAELPAPLGLTMRHEFYGDGYAHTNATTERAIEIAGKELGLNLECTYTGKAMAALLHDLELEPDGNRTVMFWQSYHAAPLPVAGDNPLDPARLPDEFLRYFS